MTSPVVSPQRERAVTVQSSQILAKPDVDRGQLVALLATLGVTAATAGAVLAMIGAPVAVTSAGVALRQTERTEAIFRAAYLVHAALRVQANVRAGMPLADAVTAERRNRDLHVAAVAKRRAAAVEVDHQAAVHGNVLGWHSVMDARTSAECRRANGRNFTVGSRPSIGWPGTVHPHCRCTAGPQFVGAGWVESQATQAERKALVA